MVAIGISIYAHVMNGRSHVFARENWLSLQGFILIPLRGFASEFYTKTFAI